MNSPSLEQLWKERAAETGKTHPDYLANKASEFPPTYTFTLDWSLTGGPPLVIDWTKDGLWNEHEGYRELLKICEQSFEAVKPRMKADSNLNAKRIEAWLKRVKAEKPSNELLAQYATYRPIIKTATDASKAGEEAKEALDEDFERDMTELSKLFYKVMNNGQSLLYDVRNDSWTKYEDCTAHYGHKKVSYYDVNVGKRVTKNVFNAYKEWNSPTRYDTVQFNPRKAGHYDTTFNLWQGFSFQPEAGDDDLLVWDLLLRVCDNNEAYFDYVQKWFAHMVQKPWELPGTCLGISGPQRMGKNVLIETFGMLLASPAMIEAITKKTTAESTKSLGSVLSTGGFGLYTSYDQVFGTFNYSTGSKLMLLMDEATWSGSNALKARFKTAITGATTSIADKFVRNVDIANHRRFILLSNNGDYLAVDPDDGRLLPLEFKTENRPSAEWFANYLRLRKDGKMLSNLMHRLQSIDISKWEPMQALRELEITTGAALQHASVPDYVHWFEDIAETGTIIVKGDKDVPEFRMPCCGKRMSEDELRQSYFFVSGNKSGLKGWNKPEFKEMRNALFGPKKQWRSGGGHERGRDVPAQDELRKRLDTTSKWKYERFADAEMVGDPGKVVSLSKKLITM